MPNIVIDQLQLSGWTGTAWQWNFRVTSDVPNTSVSSTAFSATPGPLAAHPAIKQAAIDAIEAQIASEGGNATVGALDTKALIGGVTLP